MIEKIVKITPTLLTEVLDYLDKNQDYDFYYTHDNTRVYITDERSLKSLLRESTEAYIARNKGDIVGIILVWKSIGAGTKRYYVKINTQSQQVATDLLTILTWNFNRKLHVKIKKDSKLIEVFRYKGFRFDHGRGTQVLYQREPNAFEFRAYQKEGDE